MPLLFCNDGIGCVFAPLEDKQGLNWLVGGYLWQHFFGDVWGFGLVVRPLRAALLGPGKAAFMSLETKRSDLRPKCIP